MDDKHNFKIESDKLLDSFLDKNIQEQKQILEKTFNDWQGNEKQLDDVLVMGIKI